MEYISMTKTKRIFIVGYAGVGKLARGKVLAKKLGWCKRSYEYSIKKT